MPSQLKRVSYLVIYLLIFVTFHSYSQKLVNASGNTISNNNFIVEYSIGEIGITTLSASANIITQGLLQPSLKIPNPGCGYINDTIQYFPNPTRDKIRIVGRYNWIHSFIIYATDGKLVGNRSYFNNHIDVSHLAAGIYLVVLYPGCEGKFKTLKILKQ